jgi:hypothetical protein
MFRPSRAARQTQAQAMLAYCQTQAQAWLAHSILRTPYCALHTAHSILRTPYCQTQAQAWLAHSITLRRYAAALGSAAVPARNALPSNAHLPGYVYLWLNP